MDVYWPVSTDRTHTINGPLTSYSHSPEPNTPIHRCGIEHRPAAVSFRTTTEIANEEQSSAENRRCKRSSTSLNRYLRGDHGPPRLRSLRLSHALAIARRHDQRPRNGGREPLRKIQLAAETRRNKLNLRLFDKRSTASRLVCGYNRMRPASSILMAR